MPPHETASASPGASSSPAISASAGATRPCSPLRGGGGDDDHAPELERRPKRLRQARPGATGAGSRCGRSPRRGRAAASATPSSGTRRAAARPPAGRAGRGSRARPPRSAPPVHAQMCWTDVPGLLGLPDTTTDREEDPVPLTETTTTALTTAERRALRQIQTSGDRFAVIAADHGQPLVDMLDALGLSERPGGAARVQGGSRRHGRARRQRGAARPRRVAARHRRPRRARARRRAARADRGGRPRGGGRAAPVRADPGPRRRGRTGARRHRGEGDGVPARRPRGSRRLHRRHGPRGARGLPPRRPALRHGADDLPARRREPGGVRRAQGGPRRRRRGVPAGVRLEGPQARVPGQPGARAGA